MENFSRFVRQLAPPHLASNRMEPCMLRTNQPSTRAHLVARVLLVPRQKHANKRHQRSLRHSNNHQPNEHRNRVAVLVSLLPHHREADRILRRQRHIQKLGAGALSSTTKRHRKPNNHQQLFVHQKATNHISRGPQRYISNSRRFSRHFLQPPIQFVLITASHFTTAKNLRNNFK